MSTVISRLKVEKYKQKKPLVMSHTWTFFFAFHALLLLLFRNNGAPQTVAYVIREAIASYGEVIISNRP